MNRYKGHIPDRADLLLYGLTLFNGIAQNTAILKFQKLLEALEAGTPGEILKKYHLFCIQAIENNWPQLISDLILLDDNYFARQAAVWGAKAMDPALKGLAARDLDILQEIASIDASRIKAAAHSIFAGDPSNVIGFKPLQPENWPCWDLNGTGHNNPEEGTGAAAWLQNKREGIKSKLYGSKRWSEAVEDLAHFYREVGFGIFGRFAAFRWQGDARCLHGVDNPDPIRLEQLIGLGRELGIILENTEHLLKGLPANNILLYGNRGTGKSSVIKGLLNEYASRGLRLIEVTKGDLNQLPRVISVLGGRTQKFIIFIDDLSFEGVEQDYLGLKTILEGRIEVRPENVLIYATSNRRHLVKETFGDRAGDEVHVRDSIDEKLSLADRFGITVTFAAPDQEGYLKIVEGLASRQGIAIDPDELRQMALRWALRHNGRSGRTAKQFIDDLNGKSLPVWEIDKGGVGFDT